MLAYHVIKERNGQQSLQTPITGKALLSVSQLNKGTAFTQQERKDFGLIGKLPIVVETLDQQAKRCYQQYKAFDEVLNRNLYLNQLLETNQVLFYYLVNQHLKEMLPTIYTPIVGNAVKTYHKKFQQPRGLYITYPEIDQIDEILDNRTNNDIRLVVVSDGEGVLGLGDQGAGAMAIPIAKLMVYTAFAGIDPLNTLPIMLDAGTNNQNLLDDPLYLGWHHPRISGSQYNDFIDRFVDAIKRKFPHVFLHWEDFGRNNAFRHLVKYRQTMCTFNDDIQGTGVVALAALMRALAIKQASLKEQRIVVFGAGSAGMGVTDRIFKALAQELGEEKAYQHFFLIDRHGLITQWSQDVTEEQKPYARSQKDIASWTLMDKNHITLLEVIKHAKPTVLIGCSAVSSAFSHPIIEAMYKQEKRPVILPLSNPNECCEAKPCDLLHWTEGHALIATGSPFDDVEFNNQLYPVSQCNNYLSFPGIGLGVIAVKAKKLTTLMLMAASRALSAISLKSNYELLPRLEHIKYSSRCIAIAVAKQAIEEGLALQLPSQDQTLEDLIDAHIWEPNYLPYRLAK